MPLFITHLDLRLLSSNEERICHFVLRQIFPRCRLTKQSPVFALVATFSHLSDGAAKHGQNWCYPENINKDALSTTGFPSSQLLDHRSSLVFYSRRLFGGFFCPFSTARSSHSLLLRERLTKFWGPV
jgi:hypothetical protein